MTKRIKVRGVQHTDAETDTEMIALALWIQSKRILQERRENESRARAKRREREK